MAEVTSLGQASDFIHNSMAIFSEFRCSCRWQVWDGESWRSVNIRESHLLDRAKLEAVTRELKEFKEHKNDPYSYDPGEIEAVRDLRDHAESHIEFLLYILKSAGIVTQ